MLAQQISDVVQAQHVSEGERRTTLEASVAIVNAANVQVNSFNKQAELTSSILLRNEAKTTRDRCADAVRTAPHKKKAKLNVDYKEAAQEYSDFARQAAVLMNKPYEDRKDDASFLGGSSSDGDDSDF